MNREKIAEQVRLLRARKFLDQPELAQKTGLSNATIGLIERAQPRVKLETALAVLDWLRAYEPPPPPPAPPVDQLAEAEARIAIGVLRLISPSALTLVRERFPEPPKRRKTTPETPIPELAQALDDSDEHHVDPVLADPNFDQATTLPTGTKIPGAKSRRRKETP